MFARTRHYLDGKLFEWTFSLGSLWLAVAVLVWPETVSVGAFRHLTDFFSIEWLVTFSFAVGFVGSVALATNGTAPVVGPMIRASCATGRAFLWFQFAYALQLFGNAQGIPSLGLGFWVLFTAGELYISYRAMTEAAVASRNSVSS